MLDGTRPLFLVVVKGKNVPGALGDIATRMGKAGLNILVTNDLSVPESTDSTVSFVLETRGEGAEEAIRKTVTSSPFVVDVWVKRSDSRLMIDDFAFPLMFYPSGRAVIFPQTGISAMFRDTVRMFGTGGESILFRAGFSVGTTGTDDIMKAMGGDTQLQHAASFMGLYRALGWGRLELLEASDDFRRFKLKLSQGFESDSAKSNRPNCHFTRGMISGSCERLFGSPVVCVEEKCAAAGDPFCVFSVSSRDGLSKSGSS